MIEGGVLFRYVSVLDFFALFSWFSFPRDAYVAVMRLVESVDDTVTCQKTILAELLKPLEVTRHAKSCC